MINQSARRCISALTLFAMLTLPLQNFAAHGPLYPELHVLQYSQTGKLQNGLDYCIQPETQTPNRVTIEAFVEAGWMCEEPYQRGYCLLLQRLLGQRSEQLEPSEIQELMRQIALNQDRSYVDPAHACFRIEVSASRPQDVETALYVLSQAVLYPCLDDDFIDYHCLQLLTELERIEQAGVYIPGLAGVENPAQAAQLMRAELAEADPAELRVFYQNLYQPQYMTLFVRGTHDTVNITEWIEQYFETPVQVEVPAADSALCAELDRAQRANADKLQLGRDIYPLVDGKVVMEEPSFLRTRFGGRLIQAGTSIAALGLAVLGSRQSNPAFYVGSAMSFLAGLPWWLSGFESDPVVVGEQREALKKLPFGKAIQDPNVQERLTPQELRQKLLEQHMAQPNMDEVVSYELRTPLFRAILQEQERDQLIGLAALHERTINRIEGHSAAVDMELSRQLEPYKAERDAMVQKAKNDYEMHPQVRLQQSLKEEQERRIKRAKDDYEQELKDLKALGVNMTSLETKAQKQDLKRLRDQQIADIKADLDVQLKPKQIALIAAAKQMREQAVAQADARYQEMLGYWKAQLNYGQRKESHAAWLKQMRATHNQKLAELLRSWPPAVPTRFVDYLIAKDVDLD